MGRFDIELKHTWEIPEKTWYLSVYLWVWDASAEDVTFCKMAWGFVLIWVGLPIRIITGFFRLFGRTKRAAGRYRDRRRQLREAKSPEVTVETKPIKEPSVTFGRAVAGRRTHFRVRHAEDPYSWGFGDGACDTSRYNTTVHRYRKTGTYSGTVECRNGDRKPRKIAFEVEVVAEPSPGVKMLDAVGVGFTKAGMGVKAASYAVTHPPRPVARAAKVGGVATLYACVAALGLSALGAMVLVAVTIPTWVPAIANGTHVVFTNDAVQKGGEGLFAVVLLAAFLYFTVISGIALAFRSVVAKPALRGTQRGAMRFWKMMWIGYKAVKSNTCPRIVVRQEVVEEDECSTSS